MLFKKIITLFSVVVACTAPADIQAFFLFKKKTSFESNKLLHVPTPANSVIVFDLHDVLFEWDKKTLRQQFKLSKERPKHGLANRIGAMAVLPFVALGAKITKKPLGCFYAHGLLKGLKHKYVDMAGCYTPNIAMFELIDELKTQGYTVVLASNVDPDSLVDLKERFPILHNKFDKELYPSADNKWVSKRQPKKFYRQLQKLVGNKQIIFIDDKEKNCRNAQKYGVDVALKFTSTEQLRLKLKTLKILS